MKLDNITPDNEQNFLGLKCSPSSIICREKTIILGSVTIGADCVIHPTAKIIAKNGPIIIGNNNLIEERVELINVHEEPMIIGNNNRFEVDSKCKAKRVGDNNWLEPKSGVPSNAELTEFCIIGSGCNMIKHNELNEPDTGPADVFAPYTVVSGQDQQRRIVNQLPPSSHNFQLDFLRKILPNYNKLWKPSFLASRTSNQGLSNSPQPRGH